MLTRANYVDALAALEDAGHADTAKEIDEYVQHLQTTNRDNTKKMFHLVMEACRFLTAEQLTEFGRRNPDVDITVCRPERD